MSTTSRYSIAVMLAIYAALVAMMIADIRAEFGSGQRVEPACGRSAICLRKVARSN